MKLFLSDLLYIKNRLMTKFTEVSTYKFYEDINKYGYVIIENFISESDVKLLSALTLEIHDKNKDKLCYDNNDFSDERMYGIDYSSPIFSFLFSQSFIKELCNSIQGDSFLNRFLMSNVVKSSSSGLGSGGGWHRDSPYRHQFKAFLFLTDVTNNSGPLSYIKSTNRTSFIRRIHDRLGVSESIYRYSDEQIDSVLQMPDLVADNVLCTAGSLVLADTRGIHRGTPVISGQRVALTTYFFDKSIPASFAAKIKTGSTK